MVMTGCLTELERWGLRHYLHGIVGGWFGLQDGVSEELGECRAQCCVDLLHCRVTSERGEAGDAMIGDTAWNDAGEMGQVRIDVEA